MRDITLHGASVSVRHDPAGLFFIYDGVGSERDGFAWMTKWAVAASMRAGPPR